MSFDRYFDVHDDMPQMDQFVAFAVGLAPRATHLPYMDLNEVDMADQAEGSSTGLACQLASGVIGAEAIKGLLQKPSLRAAPYYAHLTRLSHEIASRTSATREPWATPATEEICA